MTNLKDTKILSIFDFVSKDRKTKHRLQETYSGKLEDNEISEVSAGNSCVDSCTPTPDGQCIYSGDCKI